MRHALGVILLLVVGSANAATIVYSSEDVVTGIGGLDIGGTLYNVDFEALGGFSTFGGEVDFWSDGEEAFAASLAINATLNSIGEELTITVNNSFETFYLVNWGDGDFATENLRFGPWVVVEIDGPRNPDYVTAWSVVPLPAAVWLFGSALAGLGWFRRRQTA